MQDSTPNGGLGSAGSSAQHSSSYDDGKDQGNRVRIETYALLASLLRQSPSADLLATLAQVETPDATSPRQSRLEKAWAELAKAAEIADPDKLESEFHKLFIGVGQGELLPYGSWYISGAMMDRPLAALRDDLARIGLQRAEGVSEPEDHAAAICETMVLLADPDQGLPLSEQYHFFSAHVGVWLGRFFQDLQEAKSATFYASVGQLGEAFIEFEKVWLELPE